MGLFCNFFQPQHSFLVAIFSTMKDTVMIKYKKVKDWVKFAFVKCCQNFTGTPFFSTNFFLKLVSLSFSENQISNPEENKVVI